MFLREINYHVCTQDREGWEKGWGNVKTMWEEGCVCAFFFVVAANGFGEDCGAGLFGGGGSDINFLFLLRRMVFGNFTV